MNPHTIPDTVPARRLAHLPLPLFAAPMGFGGLGLAWREAAHVLDAPAIIGETLLGLAGAIWLVVTGLHVIRALGSSSSLLNDLRHPVRSAFTGAISIGMMLVAAGVLPYSSTMATGIWSAAVALHIIIGIWLLRELFKAPREASTLTPPLLIPLVGNVVAPIIGAKLGFVAISWMLFGFGCVLWASLQPLLLGRIFNGPALPERLRPTLVIFLAPPAVSTVAVANLTGEVGPFALACFGYAAMLALIFVTMIPEFRRVPFAMSWWGWTFPTATFATASFTVVRSHSSSWHHPALWIILLGASLILFIVSVATLKSAINGKLFQPE